MATENLPVYNRTRELYLQIEASTKKLPVNIRKLLLEKIEDSIIGIMEYLAFADKTSDNKFRIKFIEDSIKTLEQVEIRIRIMRDLHFMSKKGFSSIVRIEDDVMRQLAGWKNYMEKNLNNE